MLIIVEECVTFVQNVYYQLKGFEWIEIIRISGRNHAVQNFLSIIKFLENSDYRTM
jgi:hypothetical protein